MLENIKQAAVEKNGYSKCSELGMERKGNSIISGLGTGPRGVWGKTSKNRTRVKGTAGKTVPLNGCVTNSPALYILYI